MSERQHTFVNRTLIDGAVVALIGGILLLGGGAAYHQWTALNEFGGHMGGAASIHVTNPVWFLLGTIVAVSTVGGVYLGVRDRFGSTGPYDELAESSMGPDADPALCRDRGLLNLLPDDERRILGPVLNSPGVTQIELRDRAGFSKSKVSQTVTALEKRGLLYRHPQGRTYRVYPSEDIERHQ